MVMMLGVTLMLMTKTSRIILYVFTLLEVLLVALTIHNLN
jgi:hypothetical protein